MGIRYNKDRLHFIYNLIVRNLALKNGVYQMTAFRGSDRIISRTFPELVLTAEQVLDVEY
ncbi:MAG: hypothetical protein ACRC62_23555 [Microcoleus sp.]